MTDADRRLSVLVVDDDAVSRQALERALLNEPVLQARGLVTQRAGDGKRALGQIKKEMPDLVIIDLFMPRMDGFELARTLRQSPDTEHLPIIVVSGVFKEDDQVTALLQEIGGRFFTKPVPVAELATAILELIDGGDGGVTSAPARPVPTKTQAPAPGHATAPATAKAPPAAPPGAAPRTGTGIATVAPRTGAGPAPTGFGAAPSSQTAIPPVEPAGAARTPTGPYGSIKGTPAGRPGAPGETGIAGAYSRSVTVIGQPLPPDGAAPMAGIAATVGDLAQVPVPRLIIDHMLAESTGTLVLQRGQMRKDVYFHNGKPVAAASNLRQEALGRLLVSRGVLDEDQLTFLLGEMKKSGEKMGAVLVQLGWLSPEDVLKYLVAQTRKRVVDSLRYPDGAYEFTPGSDFLEREIENDLDMPRLLFVGLQKTASPDAMVERLVEQHGGSTILTSPRYEAFRIPFDEVFGPELGRVLKDEPTVGALVMRPDAAALLVAAEALVLCGLASFEAPSSDSDIETPTAEETARSSALSLEELGAESMVPAQSSEALPDLDVNFATEPKGAGDTPLEGPHGAIPNVSYTEADSGVVNMDAIASLSLRIPSGVPAPPAKKGPDPKSVVLNAYLQIHGKNLYQILGVEPDATIDQIVAAYEERTRAFAPDLFDAADLGADAAKMENIRSAYNRAFKVLSNPRLRQEYDRAQRPLEGQASGDLVGAELLFGEARQLLRAGQAAKAIAKFEAAIKAAPDEPVHHAYLGWALFEARGKSAAAAARQKIEHALSLDPDQVDSHDFLGQIAAATGDEETARVALDKALELDPTRSHCLDALIPIFANYSEFHATERLYKRTLRALGDRNLPLRQRLWKDLAGLYENEFDDHASARIAYEMAARISPDDVELQRKVVSLNAKDLDRWKDIARALAAEWKVRPDDAEVGAALVDLFLRVGKNDAATIAAAAMVLRGLAKREHQVLAEKSAPRLLTRLSQPIEGSILQRAKHPGEDKDVEMLFATLAHEGILPPFSDTDVGLYGDPPLAEKNQPEVFKRVLDYVCGVLKVKRPGRIFEFEALEHDARLADTRPHALFVGPTLLHSSDTVELGFRLGRAMSFGSPGRLTGASRSGRQLRPYLMACMAYARQSLAGGDIDIVPIVERLDNCDPAVRARLKDLGSRLVMDRPAINLSSWAKALNRTATRLGLLISGDLLRVGRTVNDEDGAEAADELIEFALSLEHFDLREELGVSSVV